MLKICVTTSNLYLHLIPVFTYLFNRYWSSEQEVTILGYNVPQCELPNNFKFVSMGEQGPVDEWSTDLRKYFESLPETHFIILMEDCLVKRCDTVTVNEIYKTLISGQNNHVGRYDLTNDIHKREHRVINNSFVRAGGNTNYRVSMQPSIWNKKFLLHYLTPGLSPWAMEKQEAKNDGWDILGLLAPPLKVNEGVRKHDIHKLDLNGFPQEDIDYINTFLV